MDKYAKPVYQLAYARTRSREAAEDIFQDVFLRLVHKRPVFDSEEHEKAWFCQVTVNCANSYWRNPFRRRTQSLDGTEAGVLAAPGPEEGIGELNACLDRLSPELRAVLSGEQKPRRHLTRRGLTALAAAAVLTVTALAVGPTIWQAIRNDLGNRAPYATEVEAACEDQGIRIEVQAALADTRVTRLYFTLHDLTGNTLDADTTSDLILSQETGGQFDWGNGGKGLEVLSYDPEQHLATLVYSRGTADLADSPPTRARLEAAYFIPGHRQARLALAQDELPAQSLESTVTDTGATILLPGQNPMTLDKDGAVSISSIGFAADGRYHVRFVQKEDVFPLMDAPAMWSITCMTRRNRTAGLSRAWETSPAPPWRAAGTSACPV